VNHTEEDVARQSVTLSNLYKQLSKTDGDNEIEVGVNGELEVQESEAEAE